MRRSSLVLWLLLAAVVATTLALASPGAIGERLSARFLPRIPGILVGCALLLLFYGLSRLASRLVQRFLERVQTDPALASLLLPLVRITILTLGLLVAVEQMGFHVGSLVAGLGIAGLALGLAAQESLANLFAGIVLLWDRPFRLGDAVTIGGSYGTVTGIGLRSTRLCTLEQLEVVIPNKDVAQQRIVNHSRYPEIRLNIALAVGFDEELDRVRRVLLESFAQEREVLADPAPQVVVVALADSAVQIQLRVWVKNPVAESATTFRYLELAKRALDDAGIASPTPQRTLRLPEPVRVTTEVRDAR